MWYGDESKSLNWIERPRFIAGVGAESSVNLGERGGAMKRLLSRTADNLCGGEDTGTKNMRSIHSGWLVHTTLLTLVELQL